MQTVKNFRANNGLRVTIGPEEPSGDTPSASHSLSSSLREGAGDGLHHSSGYSLKSGVTGDFHRPYETLNVSHFTIYRSTCPFGAIQFSGVSKPWGFLDCQFQESRHMSARVSLASQWSTSRLLVGSA